MRYRDEPKETPATDEASQRHDSVNRSEQDGVNKKIHLALAGVGNCASSLLQVLEYYRHRDPSKVAVHRPGN